MGKIPDQGLFQGFLRRPSEGSRHQGQQDQGVQEGNRRPSVRLPPEDSPEPERRRDWRV